MVSRERRSKAGKQKPLRRVMLSSCKNTAWERSKCLRHPQPPGPVLPCSDLGPVRRPLGGPGPSNTLGRGGCGRMAVRGVWG